jgi:hypothetical protein
MNPDRLCVTAGCEGNHPGKGNKQLELKEIMDSSNGISWRGCDP